MDTTKYIFIEVLHGIPKSHDVLIWHSFSTMLEPSVIFLLEHLENVWHVSVVSDFILFFKSWIYSDLIRAVQDLKENGRCLVPALLPPACLSLCYRDNRKARVIPTAANQSTPSENDKTCSLRSGLH